jgi:hypothetical protein
MFWVDTAGSQLAIPGAKEGEVSVLRNATSVFVDVSDSKVGLAYNADPFTRTFDCRAETDARECTKRELERRLNAPQWFLDGSVSVSGKEGKGSLFSGGTFNPEIQLSFSVDRTTRLPTEGLRHFHFYAGPTLSIKQIKAAVERAGVFELKDESNLATGYQVGVISWMSETVRIGLSHSGAFAWNNPGDREPSQVCVESKQGLDSSGNPVTISECAERQIGPLPNEFVTQTRLDFVNHFGSARRESFSVAGGVGVSSEPGVSAKWNVTLGPVLHPRGRPYHSLLAVLLTVPDLTDVENKNKTIAEKLKLTMFLGIPILQ